MSDKIVIMGASRGLGRALAENLIQKGHNLLLISRNHTKLAEIQALAKGQVKIEVGDFSKDDEAKRILPILQDFGSKKIFYVAGGGPYGKFHEKEWKDHSWAYRVNFGFPARLLHLLLQNKKDFPDLQQMIFVGSSVAESNPDPMAAAYAAAKHALIGLIHSVQKESAPLDLRIFSPGYMDTEMLPQNAWPRQKGLAENPAVIAEKLYQWTLQDDANGHLVLGSPNR